MKPPPPPLSSKESTTNLQKEALNPSLEKKKIRFVFPFSFRLQVHFLIQHHTYLVDVVGSWKPLVLLLAVEDKDVSTQCLDSRIKSCFTAYLPTGLQGRGRGAG
ncbi:unnamed protein product [Lactuca virosa]|uniref:Uncharacterized protein n=1 Tax=Lactuca virosa TaxID=75947 RepID=A0AAU9MFI1_9ASTR|nr:unnamed protein product [Lactuca virosa]